MGRLSCCLSVPRDTRILGNLALKIFKMLHDEFLYDESLNSYQSHIYMLARLWATHLLFTAYEHWVWSSWVDPYELVMWLNQEFTCTFTHICCFYSRSTIHIYPLIPSPEPPKNILLLIRERIAKNISVFPLWNKCSSYLGYYHLLHYLMRRVL